MSSYGVNNQRWIKYKFAIIKIQWWKIRCYRMSVTERTYNVHSLYINYFIQPIMISAVITGSSCGCWWQSVYHSDICNYDDYIAQSANHSEVNSMFLKAISIVHVSIWDDDCCIMNIIMAWKIIIFVATTSDWVCYVQLKSIKFGQHNMKS